MSNITRRSFVAAASLTAGSLIAMRSATGEESPDRRLLELHAGFSARCKAGIAAVPLESFQPAPIGPPLGAGRPPFTRSFGYSVAGFALAALSRNEQVDEANRQLTELCRYFIANGTIRDDKDNFYWWTNQVVRSIKFYGREGSISRGRLTNEVEDLAHEMMWLWVKAFSLVAETVVHPEYWFVRESENHHIQGFTACWSFCGLLLKDPKYRDRLLNDGHSVAEHYAAWTQFAKYYFAEKAKRGLFIETASLYNDLSIKGVIDFYDFTSDPEVRRLAGLLLDLYWASWAQEQLDGVRGGARARTYAGTGSSRGADIYKRLAWYYMELGSPAVPARPEEMGYLTSEYQPPPVVMDLALNRQGRGVYEIKQWPLGLAVPGFYTPKTGYRLKTEAGGIYRYSYCTPAFILGTLMFESHPESDWTMISSQNRWQGVIFEGDPDARIFPVPQPLSDEREYNSWWSVQSHGTLITKRLEEPYSLATGGMQVWFSRAGLGERAVRDGWVFVAAHSAYAAVRVVDGGFHWEAVQTPKSGAGDWLICENPDTAVILEVAEQRNFADYAAFQQKILTRPVTLAAGELTYESIYGETLKFDLKNHQPPRINGHLPDYSPRMSFESPFLTAKWNSGVVDVRMGSGRLTLDFRARGAK